MFFAAVPSLTLAPVPFFAAGNAAEQSSRMAAMDNASNNANDMIMRFTLAYNRARQARITTELTEIVSGAESLKSEEQSTHVVQAERADRTIKDLEAIETLQSEFARTFQPTVVSAAELQKEKEKQRNRERTALKSLRKDVTPKESLAMLHNFASKTKTELDQSFKGGQVHLTYASCLRILTVTGSGAKKKDAERDAAVTMIQALLLQ